jgi:hypothetical protein
LENDNEYNPNIQAISTGNDCLNLWSVEDVMSGFVSKSRSMEVKVKENVGLIGNPEEKLVDRQE